MVAYLVCEIDVTDPEAYEAYKAPSIVAIKKYGGKYLVRAGRSVTLEGAAAPTRPFILEFESVEAAQRFYNSPEYQAVIPLRTRAAKSRFYIAEGI